VQRNLSHVRPRPVVNTAAEESKPRHVQPDAKILDHERKRKIEIQCIELRDELEERGVAEDEIEARVAELRASLQPRFPALQAAAATPTYAEAKKLRPSDTHALGAAKQSETAKMQRALGVSGDYQEGDAFDRELQERRKLERIAERERRHEESRLAWEERRRARRAEEAERDAAYASWRREASPRAERDAGRRSPWDEPPMRPDADAERDREHPRWRESPRGAPRRAPSEPRASPPAPERRAPRSPSPRRSASPPRAYIPRSPTPEGERSPTPEPPRW